LLAPVGEFGAVGVEELDPVVRGGVVGGGDDDAGVGREQGHRGGRQDAGRDRVAARLDDTTGKSLLQLWARGASVTAEEDAAAPRPERRGLAQSLDEVGRQVLPEYAPNTVRSKVPPSHGAGG